MRGAAFRYDVEYPDGRRETVLDVPKYNFNWQLVYQLRQPLDLPAGAKIHATAWYDNSAANKFNPDPTVEVRYGPQTFDEMMIGYFDMIRLGGGQER
jgi:hypothetical protein